jgi:hypothetical protein
MRMVPYMPLLSSTMMLLAAVLHGGGQLLPVHQKVAIARNGEPPCGRWPMAAANACRHAVAHGPVGGRQLRLVALGQPW